MWMKKPFPSFIGSVCVNRPICLEVAVVSCKLTRQIHMLFTEQLLCSCLLMSDGSRMVQACPHKGEHMGFPLGCHVTQKNWKTLATLDIAARCSSRGANHLSQCSIRFETALLLARSLQNYRKTQSGLRDRKSSGSAVSHEAFSSSPSCHSRSESAFRSLVETASASGSVMTMTMTQPDEVTNKCWKPGPTDMSPGVMTPCEKKQLNLCALLCRQGRLLEHCKRQCAESCGKGNQQDQEVSGKSVADSYVRVVCVHQRFRAYPV